MTVTDKARFSRRSLLAAGAAGALSACASSGPSGGGRVRPGLTPVLYYLGPAKVYALNPDGGAPVTLVDRSPPGGGRPTSIFDGIAIDPGSARIYWTDMGRPSERDGSIWRCELDGSDVTEVVAGGLTHTPKQLRIAGGRLYWSDREGMSVMRANLDGSQVQTLVRTGDPETDKGRADFWCVGVAVDPVGGFVYWTQKGGDNALQGQIRRAPLAMPRGSNAATRRDIETLFSGLPEPIDLDLDLTTRTMYWTDRGDNTLSRATMDLTRGIDPARRLDREVVLRDLGEAIGVSLDLKRKRLAWTNLDGEVGLAGLDGSDNRILVDRQGMLTGIAWVG
jgi:hypothetical protein